MRALQIQTHDNNGTIHVCHTSCSFLDGGSLESYLTSVATWITANPNDGAFYFLLAPPGPR